MLCKIAGQLEDEQEEEMSPGRCDPEEEELRQEERDSPHAAFSGWALGHRGAAPEADSSCQLACCTHASTPGVETSSAVVPTTGHSSARLPTSGTAKQREEEHWKMASDDGHRAFACGCAVAKARGGQSCLDRFGKEQFRRWHNETYGVTADGSALTHSDPATHIHRKMWELKEAISFKPGQKSDAYGRMFKVKTWLLDGHEVGCASSPSGSLRTRSTTFCLCQMCRSGWMMALGGTEKMHRLVLSSVCRGHGPGDASAQYLMKKMLRRSLPGRRGPAPIRCRIF